MKSARPPPCARCGGQQLLDYSAAAGYALDCLSCGNVQYLVLRAGALYPLQPLRYVTGREPAAHKGPGPLYGRRQW